jgi:hypothetical protein
VAARDDNADASATGPGPTRQSKTKEIPAWAHGPQDIPSGSREVLDKDKPAG